MKIKIKELKTENKNKYIDALYRALEYAQTKGETKSFISDLLTESEIIMLGRRVLIAKFLLQKMPYPKISRELGVGFDTIYKVQKWLGGRHRGYKKVVEKIKKVIPRKRRKSEFLDYYPTSGFAEIRRRYKTYYWLSDLLDEINEE